MPLPMPVELASDFMKSFNRMHKNCTKTWTEPVAEPNNENTSRSIAQNMEWWLTKGEHGISSETMFYHLSGRRVGRHESPPSDPDDFRRCYLLLKAVPQWRVDLHKLKAVSQTWANLVDNWDLLTEKLEDMMKNKKANGMYELMKSYGC